MAILTVTLGTKTATEYPDHVHPRGESRALRRTEVRCRRGVEEGGVEAAQRRRAGREGPAQGDGAELKRRAGRAADAEVRPHRERRGASLPGARAERSWSLLVFACSRWLWST